MRGNFRNRDAIEGKIAVIANTLQPVAEPGKKVLPKASNIHIAGQYDRKALM